MPVKKTRILFAISFVCLAAFGTLNVSALIIGGTTEPMKDRGWPVGTVELANLKSRIAWWEGPPLGGGEFHFEYRGDTAAFNDALKLFSAINAPELELVVHSGSSVSFWLSVADKQADARVDWTFTVWIPANWHSLYNTPSSHFASDQPNFRRPVAPPRIDVFLGGSIDWKKVDVPKGIRISDTRASAAGIESADAAIVMGAIYDIATAKPIQGAVVTVDRQSSNEQTSRLDSTSDSHGRFKIEKIPPGAYRIYVRAEGYASRMIGYEQLDADELKRLTVELSNAAVIEGTVIDADDGKPVPGIQVRLNNPLAIDGRGYSSPDPQQSVTDNAGRFKLTGVPTGFAQLWCVQKGYYHNPVLAKMIRVPGAPVKLQVVGTGRVSIKVLNEKQQPIRENYIVEIEHEGGGGVGTWGGSSQVQPDGTVTFEGVPPGKYRIFGRPNPGSVNDQSDDYWIEVTRGKTVSVTVVHKSRG